MPDVLSRTLFLCNIVGNPHEAVNLPIRAPQCSHRHLDRQRGAILAHESPFAMFRDTLPWLVSQGFEGRWNRRFGELAPFPGVVCKLTKPMKNRSVHLANKVVGLISEHLFDRAVGRDYSPVDIRRKDQ